MVPRLTSALVAFCMLTPTLAHAATKRIDLGGLILDVSNSWTAQVFHIVDQLAAWDAYAHKQYAHWAEQALRLDDTDRRLLQQHAELRRLRGRGNGFEQAFLVDASIDAAARAATVNGPLTPEEVASEKEVLLHFSNRLAGIREAGDRNIARFEDRLAVEGARIGDFVQTLRRFAESNVPVTIPVFLVTNPEERSGGGGADGDRLVVEVQQVPDPMTFVIHESLHVLLKPHETAITNAAQSAGLTFEDLNEGLAYAMAPGLTDDGTDVDTVFDQLARFMARGRPATDSYVRFYTLAGTLRPLLRSELARGGTVTAFLPKAVARWKAFTGR